MNVQDVFGGTLAERWSAAWRELRNWSMASFIVLVAAQFFHPLSVFNVGTLAVMTVGVAISSFVVPGVKRKNPRAHSEILKRIGSTE